MDIPGYQTYLAEAITPRIFKGTQGTISLRVYDSNGDLVDLTVFDLIGISMRNFPERDEVITYACVVEDAENGLCSFTFTKAESEAWLAAPYDAQMTFTIFERDIEVISAATGYIPTSRNLYVEGVTTAFQAGETVSGFLSGVTGIVREVSSYYENVQNLILCSLSGEFTDGEDLIGSLGGSGTVLGELGDPAVITNTFGDDVEDLSVAIPRDVLEIDDEQFLVDGFDEIVEEWIVTNTPLLLTGTGLSYKLLTYDPDTSGVVRIFQSEVFPMQVREIL